MVKNYLCISIPDELKMYSKEVTILDEGIEYENFSKDFGVKPVKDSCGNLIYTAYFSDTGELIKKIFYNGSSVSLIEHFRNNALFSQEKYDNGKITKKTMYNNQGKQICTIAYKHNRNDQIICIQKTTGNMIFSVEYGYDELMRVNSRIIKSSNNVIYEQNYTYDILDRIVEYVDNNQLIKVHKMNHNNELLSYTITDTAGNNIKIENNFVSSEYVGTEIELNGHKTSVKDKSYVYNVMLKKPFTSEDDLDFALSSIIKIPKISSACMCTTIRKFNEDKNSISNYVIFKKQEYEKQIPVSADKIKLLNI